MSLRVVLDTNVLISGLGYPSSIPGRLVEAWATSTIQVVLSKYILAELARNLPRIKNSHWNELKSREFVDNLPYETEIVEPAEVPHGTVRDPFDAAVLGTLIASGADYLITGDKDLLALAEKYPIVTPAAFWERHG